MTRAHEIVRQLLGEDVPVPVGVRRNTSARVRNRQSVRRRTAAAILGLAESDEPIIPDDAEELDSPSAIPGLRDVEKDAPADEAETDTEETCQDWEDQKLIPPKAALVAPDLTPHTLEPIDPSDVPKPETHASSEASPAINPLDVLLGRQSSPSAPDSSSKAQAKTMVNNILHTGSLDDALNCSKPMPDPVPGNSAKVMETFFRYTTR